MKPDHKINGRYFVEKKIIEAIGEKYVVSSDNNTFMFPYETDQSLPLGKCFVELEKEMAYSGDSLEKTPHYFIKGFKALKGKAVVLTELPKEDCDFCKDIEYGKEVGCCFECNRHIPQQSDDELAEEIEEIVKEIAKESTAPDKETPHWMEMDIRRGIMAGIKLQKEYHQVKSEGLFTKEDMTDFVSWVIDLYVNEETLNEWLESKKKEL